MHTSATWLAKRTSVGPLKAAAIALVLAFSALLVNLAVPAGASAAGAIPDATPPVSVSAVPPAEVETVLSGIPLKDLSATQLSEVLSRTPGLSALPAGSLNSALTETIKGLTAKGDTLGQLASSPELISKVETQLNKLLSPSQLLSLLEGHSLSSVLSEALSGLQARQILGELLSSSGEPKQLIEQLLAAPSPEQLQALLGSTLTGEPFSESTVGELASDAGTTPEGLAGDLNTTTLQLPASAMALTAPLTNGKTLGVLDAVEGLDLGLLSFPKEETPEGSGGSGGGSGGSGGGSGGSGGSHGGAGGSGGTGGGSSGTPASTTIVLNDLPAQSTGAMRSSTSTAVAKVKILGRKVKGDTVTLVVQVPAPGRLSLTGRGVRTVSEQTDKAERLTLRTTLTKADAASLRKHKHRITVKLKASFTRVDGPSSSAATTAAFS
jgi:hypothetical protein